MASLGRHLKRFTEAHGIGQTLQFLDQGLAERKISRADVSIKELAESIVGPTWPRACKARWQGRVSEAVEAVDASNFAAITGQLLVDEIKAKYQSADFVGDMLCDSEPITNGNLGPQRVPYHSDVIDGPSQVQQGMPYPATKFLPQWIDYPPPEKWGETCFVTFEMIFSDLTKQVFDSAGSVGRRVRIDKEERQLQVVLGLVNNFRWNDSLYQTYLSAGAWVNQISAKTIVDWTDLNDLEQLFALMLDPVTKKPIEIKPNAALVQPYKYYNWKRALHATNTRTGGYAVSGLTPQIEAANPLEQDYPVIKSKFAYQQLTNPVVPVSPNTRPGGGLTPTQAREYSFLGDFKKAFLYRYVWQQKTEELPPQNMLEFTQDILLGVKCSDYGVMCVREPRAVVESYNT